MKSRKNKWLFALAIVIVVGISGVLYINSKPKPFQPPNGSPGSAAALQFPVTREALSNSIEIRGKSSYVNETWVYGPFDAEIVSWNVQDGEQVSKGDVLFELDVKHLQSELAQLEANMKQQELNRKLKRVQDADFTDAGVEAAAGLGTPQEAFERFAKKERSKLENEIDDLNFELAKNRLQEKKDQLNEAVYTSEESGIFLFADMKQPKIAQSSAPLGKIVDLENLQLVTTVSEYDVFKIKEGMSVEVRVDALKRLKLSGTVAQVAKFARVGTDQGNNSAQFEVIVSLEPHESLIGGLSLTGKIVTESKTDALVVPTLAVMREGDEYFVYVDDQGTTVRRTVKIGMETAEKTEIIEGLNENDILVLQ